MEYFTTRKIAEKGVSEEVINLLIANESLLEDYDLFLQNVVLSGDKSVELVIQDLDQKRTDSLILELTDRNSFDAENMDIIDLVSSMCAADDERFDNLNLYTV